MGIICCPRGEEREEWPSHPLARGCCFLRLMHTRAKVMKHVEAAGFYFLEHQDVLVHQDVFDQG